MRRADRLFQIVQFLRGGRLVTAAHLAERLEVSERTIYRDIADLQGTGVPIDGEAGVGYVMRSGFDLPPLMFTHDEIVAITAGARLLRAWGGASMARAAEEALVKIEAVLPDAARDRAATIEIHSIGTGMTDHLREVLDRLQLAIDKRAIIEISYQDQNDALTKRSLRPLGLWFWGKVWTLVAWCELRDDFRMFRADRIAALEVSEFRFKPLPGKTLKDFYSRAESDSRGHPSSW